ncbi:integrase, partial [Shigella dysenteriae]
GHKTEGQVLIYDRKVKVSPTLDVPLPENIPSNSTCDFCH